MKRIILIGVMFLIAATNVSAIELSVFAGGGYGFGMDEETEGTNIERAPNGNYLNYSNKFYKNARGLRGLGEVDVAFSDYFLIGLGGGYIASTHSEGSGLAFLYNPVTSTRREAGISTSFVPFFLTLKGRIPVGRFNFYVGAGPSTCILAESKITDLMASGDVEEYWEIEATYTPGWGYHGVAGVEFRLSKRISIRMEARGEQLTFRPKKSVITVYTVNGVDELMATYPDVYDRETEYVGDLSEFLNNPVDPDAPNQDLAYNISADSVAVLMGIVWRIF